MANLMPLTPVQDHPRGCGEHVVPLPGLSKGSGSSPRMRGAHIVVVPVPALTRIIPADAGSTGWCCSIAHP